MIFGLQYCVICKIDRGEQNIKIGAECFFAQLMAHSSEKKKQSNFNIPKKYFKFTWQSVKMWIVPFWPPFSSFSACTVCCCQFCNKILPSIHSSPGIRCSVRRGPAALRVDKCPYLLLRGLSDYFGVPGSNPNPVSCIPLRFHQHKHSLKNCE